MTDPPAPSSHPRRRRRRRRIRIAIQLVVGGAAIWFVTHPGSLPAPPGADITAESDDGDSTLADSPGGDTAAVAIPLSRLPATGPAPPMVPRLAPRLVPRLVPKGRLFRSVEERARAGERIAVSITAYCLDGRTRRGNPVRDGIIAVDRALFPLGREVDIAVGRTTQRRYLADDTGGAIRGARIDIWMADCTAARRFGRRRGYAALVPRTR